MNRANIILTVSQALTRRRKIMAKYKLPEDLGSGTVTEMAPLVPLPFGNMKRTAASYGFVMLNSRIYVASGKTSIAIHV